MALAVIMSRSLFGMDAPPVRVEAHLSSGLPSFTMVGLADAEVRESRERVRAARIDSTCKQQSLRGCAIVVGCGR